MTRTIDEPREASTHRQPTGRAYHALMALALIAATGTLAGIIALVDMSQWLPRHAGTWLFAGVVVCWVTGAALWIAAIKVKPAPTKAQRRSVLARELERVAAENPDLFDFDPNLAISAGGAAADDLFTPEELNQLAALVGPPPDVTTGIPGVDARARRGGRPPLPHRLSSECVGNNT